MGRAGSELPRSHAPRGNAGPDAPRRVRTVQNLTGRGAADRAFPRSAWERETEGMPVPKSVCVLVLLVFTNAVRADQPARIGGKIDNLTFKDIRYLTRSLNDFKDRKAFVLF